MDNQYTKVIADLYNKMVNEYDILIAPFYVNQYTVYKQQLEEQDLYNLDGYILDLGCGTGIQTIELSRFNIPIIAIDIAGKLIEIAKQKCRQMKNVVFKTADATNLPIPDKSVSYVSSYGDVISHIPDYEKAISELSRVCKKDAVISIEVMNKWYLGIFCEPKEFMTAIRTSKGHIRDWQYTYQDGTSVNLKLKTFCNNEIKDLLKKHGFQPISFVGIHILSSIVPIKKQMLEHQKYINKITLFLGKLDRKINKYNPFFKLGYTVIVKARKV